MYERLLDFLRCPICRKPLRLEVLASTTSDAGREISEGLLQCADDHWFPVVEGIPRMLSGAITEHWPDIEPLVRQHDSPSVTSLKDRVDTAAGRAGHDHRTRRNFSLEWQHHELGDKTWGIELEDRVKRYFLDPIRIPVERLDGMVMLDAGCGNGSQSVAYTEFGLEVIAMDLSSGLKHGQAFRHVHKGARPELVHFVQGDLQAPPLAAGCFDLIHSSGVLHHTPNTERTFRTLCPLLRRGGTFYIWLYSYEPLVTPIVNGIRAVTTRIPPPAFARVAQLMAAPFQLFCLTVSKVGVRSYPPMARREATLALMDIFGAPYAHYHSFPEVVDWLTDEGFGEVWECNRSRRGFGACGRQNADSAPR